LSELSNPVFVKCVDPFCTVPYLLAASEASISFLSSESFFHIGSYACATSNHEQILPSYVWAKQYPDILAGLSDKVEIYIPAHELFVLL